MSKNEHSYFLGKWISIQYYLLSAPLLLQENYRKMEPISDLFVPDELSFFSVPISFIFSLNEIDFFGYQTFLSQSYSCGNFTLYEIAKNCSF